MPIKRLAQDLYVVPGLVHVYVLETVDGLALLDTGFPNGAARILAGVRAIGRRPGDIRHILLSHAHADHIGSAAALKRATGATVWAHRLDAPIIEAGTGFRPVVASPGLRNHLVTRLLLGRIAAVEPTAVDRSLEDGARLPFLPDLVALHAPGHCAGQVAFHWRRRGGVLFTADTCVHQFGLTLPPACEDVDLARRSLARLSQTDFAMACFMHGRPIASGGDAIFRATAFDR